MTSYEISQLIEQVLSARASFKPIQIRGGNTKSFYGNRFDQAGEIPVVLDMRSARGIVNYHPSELVITAMLAAILDSIKVSASIAGLTECV